MSYQHLSTHERARIETLREEGFSLREISGRLKRSVSTICRELQRNTPRQGIYRSEQAQKLYENRRISCHPKGKWNTQIAAQIEQLLQLTWSPEQIVGRLLQGIISYKTIYRWIYKGLLASQNLRVLRHKGKRQKPQETRGKFNVGTLIGTRPKEVKERISFGHWELDSLVSGRGKSKGCLATFVERKTRWYVALKMPNRTAASMKEAIRSLNESLPQGAFQTATVDRGKEFACYPYVEADLGISMYFADPYSSWQRGSNENANGLLREFFPKGTDLAKVSPDLILALQFINHRLRKCLEWKSSHEAFEQELLHLA